MRREWEGWEVARFSAFTRQDGWGVPCWLMRFAMRMDGTLDILRGGGVPTAGALAGLLAAEGQALEMLCRAAQRVRMERVGANVYLRGLVEMGNGCRKDCFYCGIRRSNAAVHRYSLPDEEVLAAARFAFRNGYANVAIQAGEDGSSAFAARIERLLYAIAEATRGELGVTLSLGEQRQSTYQRWRDAGASRYLLRLETSSSALYAALHPSDAEHSFEGRRASLRALRDCGYHVGSGVMVGLPGQTLLDLADDLLWLRAADVDMVGLGPYLEHPQTPLWVRRGELWPRAERLRVAVAMVAVLRLLMPTINIAATTALQAIVPDGRERAIAAGANVIMPNITPRGRQDDYSLYERKPLAADAAEDSLPSLAARIAALGCRLAVGERGDSLHFALRDSPAGVW